MAEKRTSAAAPILIAVLCLLVPLGAYVAGYFWLGDSTYSVSTVSGNLAANRLFRVYPYKWQSHIYQPAGWLETRLRGCRVIVQSRDDNPFD